MSDFDFNENPHFDVETIVLPCEKDDSDTVFAVRKAVMRGFETFLLIGVAGARLDRTPGNVLILLYLDWLGKSGCIIDDYSEMEIAFDQGLGKGILHSNAKLSLLCLSREHIQLKRNHRSGAKATDRWLFLVISSTGYFFDEAA